jgi:hypothetical protein
MRRLSTLITADHAGRILSHGAFLDIARHAA